MEKVLIVEDSKVYAKAMQKSLESHFGFDVDVAHSYAEAAAFLEENLYCVSIVDLMLPDSESAHIPIILKKSEVIVITEYEDELTRKKITSLEIIDYIIKSDSKEFSYLHNILHRLMQNRKLKVLVVDDSKPVRTLMSLLLKVQHLNTIEACDGVEALEILENNRIDLVVADYNMPRMDGLQLLKKIRQKHYIDELPVIVLSSVGAEATIARFLKAGANDYITKPFSKEEFFCRINLALNNYEMMKQIKRSATTDFLTGLHNRAYMSDRFRAIEEDNNKDNSLAIIDIDYFKKLNDSFGHHTGDMALKFFAIHLIRHFDSKNVMRIGGEEFLVLFPNISHKKAIILMESFRKEIEDSSFKDEENRRIEFTISVGLSSFEDSHSDFAMREADLLLYKAKTNGRNKVEFTLKEKK